MPRPKTATAPPPRLAYKVSEVADMLGLSESTIYNMVNRGDLKGSMLGRALRIPSTEVDRLMRRTAGQPFTPRAHS